MHRFLTTLTLLLAAHAATAQQPPDGGRRVGQVTVYGRRPMREIGIDETRFDSLALQENIAQSMADVLTFHSGVFVKSYGRATLSTVAFRGTSASHTQVTWNGMRINSPMLGMTDFSTIPSFLIDTADLLHGTSSVTATGGGLGGAVRLGTDGGTGRHPDGWAAQYVQGAGSFNTFDEYARVGYTRGRWHITTRAVLSTSPNDYRYVNHDKKIHDTASPAGRHPTERNRSGAFRDLHLLGEATYAATPRDRVSLSAWWSHLRRHLPMLTTTYASDLDFTNLQRDNTLRAVARWQHCDAAITSTVSAGMMRAHTAYDYEREVARGNMVPMTRSRTTATTLYAAAQAEWHAAERWLLTAQADLHHQSVRSADQNVTTQNGADATVGYRRRRAELSSCLSARWQPVDGVGLAAVVREECYGDRVSAPIPALLADAVLYQPCALTVRAALSRNYRVPTLNDLYFLPGGNPDLRDERGLSWEAGLSARRDITARLSVGGSVTWFDSHIRDWILWLPTVKGFYSPQNVKRVHAYGIEAQADATCKPARQCLLSLRASYSWTPSVNQSAPASAADRSVGKQLPYIPRHSASLTANADCGPWSVLYKWCHYSERYTMTSNEHTLTGRLPLYFMNNISLERRLHTAAADLALRIAVNNLFDEDYISVLSHPMPGRNFELFLRITPRLGRRQK